MGKCLFGGKNCFLLSKKTGFFPNLKCCIFKNFCFWKVPEKPVGKKFKFITWNINKDDPFLKERTGAICKYLQEQMPDAFFTQKIISESHDILKEWADKNNYTFVKGGEGNYYVAAIFNRDTVSLIGKGIDIIPLPKSEDRRTLLALHVNIAGSEFYLMTSHLASFEEHVDERLEQLKVVMNQFLLAPANAKAIFAGDTNLNDGELDKFGGLPKNVFDVWEFLGKSPDTWCTWTRKVKGVVMKKRYDRFFVRQGAHSENIFADRLSLLGLEKLEHGEYPSDHRGVVVTFNLLD